MTNMCIIIKNISSQPKATWDCEYELRINDVRVATFRHDRRQGLAACLGAASMAAEDRKVMQLVQDYLAYKAFLKEPL